MPKRPIKNVRLGKALRNQRKVPVKSQVAKSLRRRGAARKK